MRGLLVVNPKATATTARTRDVLARALGSELKVDVAETRARGHATDLGRQAALDGLDVVVTLGGDGTVNEVVNGLLANGPDAALPGLAVVPGGSANVFARTLGMPNSPVEAIGEILQSLRSGRARSIGLGRAGDRWFTFCAGLGLDAEVVEIVERRRRAGRPATPALYVRTAIRHFYAGADRRDPALTLERPGHDPVEQLFLALVSNTTPWTYLGDRPVQPSPEAEFGAGLDIYAAGRLRTLSTLRYLRQMLARRPRPHGRSLTRLHDLDEFTVTAARPVALQVDGEFVGAIDQISFRSVPAALRVIA